MKLRVAEVRHVTSDVLHLTLVHPLRPTLPRWTAGAHVDLRLPDGRIRQYSLCGDPADCSRYEVAIKREAEGRGGSRWVHESAASEAILHVSAPRNNFELAATAYRHVLVAGGIGVTPVVAMARSLKAAQADFEVHFCVPSEDRAPLLPELRDICGSRLSVWSSADQRRFDPRLLGSPRDGTHVYACGPQSLSAAVEAALTQAEWPASQVHVEAFQATADENFKPEPFDVHIASTGQILHVPADRSLLDVLRTNGFEIRASCEAGVCGSCECGYRSGSVIHRDKVLPLSKRQDRIMPCVSRARLEMTLDL